MKTNHIDLYNGTVTHVGRKLVVLCGWNTPGVATFKVVKDFREFSVSGNHVDVAIGDKIKGLRGYRLESVDRRPFDDAEAPKDALVRARITR